MTTGEYILALLAIISGLAITHLIGATSMLIENRRRVHWDWLAVLAAAYLGYLVIYSWWISFAAFHAEKAQLPFYRFLMPTVNAIFLALAARAVLPDRLAEEPLDLAAHYARSSRFIFGCLLVSQAITTLSLATRWHTLRHAATALPGGLMPFLGGAAFIVALTLIRRRIVHALLVPTMFAALVAGSITRVV